ncbi:helix-turn-helix transcriptional regulator [Streptomyces sp. Tu10]|uniref:helix-turn-helix domain-containing protein n=1 Tax=Streptomyces sp. Tu10 TaxID=2838018 RepID=UPI001BDC47B9|nr:helix-turn-helix transcriptional regulator [Streptomyces sp. Tu10]MBT1103089.1 helix-turn-helix domain-containing protein [Streptomyces sp. Tu10]
MLSSQPLFVVPDGAKPSGIPAGAGRVLGARLRQLREGLGLRGADVVKAGVIGSVATLSRIENAITPLREETVLALARYYGVTEAEELDVMAGLVHKSHTDVWWGEFHDVVPGWMERLISVEASAKSIRTYQLQYIPGLLQTGPYARALMQVHSEPGMNAAQVERNVERRVQVRLIRQGLLQSSSPPQYYAVIDENALVRRVGGTAVIREQLRQLYSWEENREHVHLRIIPFDRGAEALAPAASMTHLTFPSGREMDMVYLEVPDSGTYVTRTQDLVRYKLSLTSLWQLAADRTETLRILERHIEGLEG